MRNLTPEENKNCRKEYIFLACVAIPAIVIALAICLIK